MTEQPNNLDQPSIGEIRNNAKSRLDALATPDRNVDIEDRILATYEIDQEGLDPTTKRRLALSAVSYDYAVVSLFDDRGEPTNHGYQFFEVFEHGKFRHEGLNSQGMTEELKRRLQNDGWSKQRRSYTDNDGYMGNINVSQQEEQPDTRDIAEHYAFFYGTGSIVTVPGEISIGYGAIEYKVADNYVGQYGGEHARRTILTRVPDHINEG